MRGGVSNEIKKMRDELLNLTSLIELELDFSEEDVEFASRDKFLSLLNNVEVFISDLVDSFKYVKLINIPLLFSEILSVSFLIMLNISHCSL